MAKQSILINRKKYAAGLFWQPMAAHANARDLARKLSRQIPGHFNIFAEYKSQVGIAEKSSGARAGQSLLAAEVADAFPTLNSIAAAFAVAGGFYIFVQRNNVILADRFYDNETEAKAAFAEFAKLPDWDALYAPGFWSIPRAAEKDLATIVSGRDRFRTQNIFRWKGELISLLLVIAILFGAYYFYGDKIGALLAPRPQNADIDQALLAEYQAQMRIKAAEINDDKPVATPMPYDNLPDAGLRAAQCFNGIAFVMQQIPGWAVESAECADNINATIARGPGTILDAYNVSADIMPGAVLTELSESRIRITAALSRLPGSASLEESDAETVIRNISSVFQLMGMNAKISADTEIVRKSNGDTRANFVFVAADSKLMPSEFIKIFSDFAGVELPRVGWNNKSRIWNYEVKIYVK